MKRSILTTSLLLALATGSQAAVSLVQSYDLDTVFYQGPVPSGATYSLPSIEKTFQPFDSTLGELEFAQITWNITMEAQGTTGNSGGSVSFSFAPDVYVNDIRYNGFGGGGGVGGPADTFVSDSDQETEESQFRATDTNSLYQQVWAVVTGSSEFTIEGFTLDEEFGSYQFFNSFSDAQVSLIDSSLTLTYSYTPVPEPSSSLLFSITSLWFFLRRRR